MGEKTKGGRKQGEREERNVTLSECVCSQREREREKVRESERERERERESTRIPDVDGSINILSCEDIVHNPFKDNENRRRRREREKIT